MDTVFKPNQVVEIHEGGVGRVWYHRKSKRSVYILMLTGPRAWTLKKYDELLVRPLNNYYMITPFPIK